MMEARAAALRVTVTRAAKEVAVRVAARVAATEAASAGRPAL